MSETDSNDNHPDTRTYADIPAKFGRWTRTSPARLINGRSICNVACECGTRAEKRVYDLVTARSLSCGCAPADEDSNSLYDDEPDLSPSEVEEILGNPPIDRPTTRSQCAPAGNPTPAGPLHVRPCPWASCMYRLPQFPGASESCALDVAERGRHTQVSIGRMLGLSKQRIDQIEKEALAKLLETNADLEDAIACFPHPEEFR